LTRDWREKRGLAGKKGEYRKRKEKVYRGMTCGKAEFFPRKELIQSGIIQVVLQLPRESKKESALRPFYEI
jgi:hypothetical protein